MLTTDLEELLLAAKDCGVNTNNPDTCGVCGLHFAECEEDTYSAGDDADQSGAVHVFACPGARIRVALSHMPT